MGVMALIRKRREKTPYQASRVIVKAIAMTLLIFLFTLPSIQFPQHEVVKPTGKYQVATETYSYADTKRIETYADTGEYRMVKVGMWFPKNAAGKFPFIVFSPGAFGMKTSNQSLFNELASHGYVVCSMDHAYQCLYTRGDAGHMKVVDRGYVKEITSENATINRQQSYELYQKWMKIRTGDMNFAMDTILSEVQTDDADTAYKCMDTTKIGVIG